MIKLEVKKLVESIVKQKGGEDGFDFDELREQGQELFRNEDMTESGLHMVCSIMLYVFGLLNAPDVYFSLQRLMGKPSKGFGTYYTGWVGKFIKFYTFVTIEAIFSPYFGEETAGNGEIVELRGMDRVMCLILASVMLLHNLEYAQKTYQEFKDGEKLNIPLEIVEFLVRGFMQYILFRVGAIFITDPWPMEGSIRWVVFLVGVANLFFNAKDMYNNK